MDQPQKQPVIIGNWKMYKTIEEAVSFVNKLAPEIKESKAAVYLAVPYTAIKSVVEAVKGTSIVVGGQNMNDATQGAFTGEIAVRMLLDLGAHFVLLGHSERRRFFHEDDAFINRKVDRALTDGLQPILCVGETAEERDQGKTEEVLTRQLKECLNNIDPSRIDSLMIAYEPVWAIGTGKIATTEQAQAMHQFCRHWIQETYGPQASAQLKILYGGSVTPENAAEMLKQADIDGLLVGGASLSVESFSQIITSTS
jgi:triosephosphate isomerase